MQLNPYLSFNGRCEAAFKFYERCLGGKIECMMTYERRPPEYPVPPERRSNLSRKLPVIQPTGPDKVRQPGHRALVAIVAPHGGARTFRVTT